MWDSCEMPQFFAERVSKAAKPYKCCECAKAINKGQLYWYCSGKWDGEMSWYRQHIECRDACYAVGQKEEDCIPFGSLWEYVTDFPTAWQTQRDGSEILTKRSEFETKVRSLYARGKWASRYKDDRVKAYNAMHAARKP